MNSRMDKYSDGTVAVKERSERNKKLYDQVQDMNIDYIDIDVDNAIEINPYGGNKKTRSDYQKQRELSSVLSTTEKENIKVEDETLPKEEKIYDINEILKLAKENKLFEDDSKKRLINTEYNILTKLDIDEITNKKDLSKENLKDLIDTIYENEKPKEKIEVSETEEKDLLGDLVSESNDEEEIEPGTEEEIVLEEEVSKDILDKDVEEDEEVKPNNEYTSTTTDLSIDINKSNKGIVVIIILVLAILAFAGYMLFRYFSA